MADDSEWPKKKYANEQERKSHKPVLEKKRRQRINKSLDALKSLLLEAVKGDGAHHSKLEKADILEMTVRHLKDTQRNQLNVAMTVDPTVIRRYHSGFSECATEVRRYLSTIDGIKPEVKSRLIGHLSNCSNGLNNLSTGAPGAHPTLLQTPLSPPIYARQIIDVAPMQVSPEMLSNTTSAQSNRVTPLYVQAQQQPNRVHILQRHPQHTQAPVSTPFRQTPPTCTPIRRQSVSPTFSSPSPHISPIERSSTNQRVSPNGLSSSFKHYRRPNKPEATLSSPSFESDSVNSTSDRSASSREMECKHFNDSSSLSQTSLDSENNRNRILTSDTSDSSLLSTPVIQSVNIKSTKLFSHSTPKGRPLSVGNSFSSENKTNVDKFLNKNNNFTDSGNKENCPQIPLSYGGNQLKQENMWRPW